MKHALLTAAVLVLVATTAVAQYGSVGIYADPTGCQCSVYDQVPGIVNVWVVHRNITSGVTGVHFDIETGDWIGPLSGTYAIRYALPYGDWLGLYIYDYGSDSWTQAVYSYRENW